MGLEIGMIIAGASGIVLLVLAGKRFQKRSQERRGIIGTIFLDLGVIIGTIFIVISILSAVRLGEINSTRKLAELTGKPMWRISDSEKSELFRFVPAAKRF